MGRYLVRWEIDWSKIPINPKERAEGWAALVEVAKQDIKKGIVKDWGGFVGESKGYTVVEGSIEEVGMYTQQYVPFCRFEFHEVALISQAEGMLKKMAK